MGAADPLAGDVAGELVRARRRTALDPVPGRRDLLRLAAVRRRAGARDGRLPVRSPNAVGSSFVVQGTARFHARRLIGGGELPLRVRRPFHRVPVPVMRRGLGHVGHRRLQFGVRRVGERRLRDGPRRRSRLGGGCLREVGRCPGRPSRPRRSPSRPPAPRRPQSRPHRPRPDRGGRRRRPARPRAVCQGPRRRRRSLVVGHRMPPCRRPSWWVSAGSSGVDDSGQHDRREPPPPPTTANPGRRGLPGFVARDREHPVTSVPGG